MEYREIVSVTGIGGLYQLLSTKSDGAIVRNLADNSTKFISARLHNVTPLESIEIYTTGNNVRLHEVLQKMKDSEVPRPDTKKSSTEQVKAYFRSVYPDLDEERVYISDMKKMVKWYDLLQTNNLLDFSNLQRPEEDEAGTELMAEGEAQIAEHQKEGDAEVALVEDAEKPAAKKAARAKKTTDEAADAEATEVGEGEEKPAKKAAAKKKKVEGEEATGEEKPAKKTAKKKKEEE